MAGDERGRADPRVLPGIEICPLRAATTWRPIYPSVREGWPATIRLERDWSGVSGSILEGIDEILTVTRLGLPKELRRSLACTNIIENVMGHGAARLPQRKTLALGLDGDALDRSRYAGSSQRLPTLKAHKQLPALRAALEAHQTRNSTRDVLARQANAA